MKHTKTTKHHLNTRADVIRTMLLEAIRGDRTALDGFIDTLRYDHGLDIFKIAKKAYRHFGLPISYTEDILRHSCN